MSSLRERMTYNTDMDNGSRDNTPQKSDIDEEEDDHAEPDADAAKKMPQASDKTTEVIDSALKDLTPRWRNWVIRGIFTWLMIFSFMFIIYLGPAALALLVLVIQIKCFHEIITIGYVVYRSYDLPWFRTLSWYFLFTSNYFLYGESMAEYCAILPRGMIPWQYLRYHRFIAFSLYVAGFVGFVFSLVKKFYLKQFTLFGWTHVTLVIVVTQSHLIVQNIFQGLIWFLVPVSMVICNDIMAYMFGFFFGKTPLIKLSPKKTWEGFIGGALSTVVFGLVLSWILCHFDFFVCPASYNEELNSVMMHCERRPEFTLMKYEFLHCIQSLFSLIRLPWKHISMYPFVWHSVSFSIFASVLGPFGGFFASGFKRAFKIKDFGDTIPGHGGIMDRFDCQFLMATFVHVYHSSFITIPNPQKIFQSVMTLKPEQQVQVFEMLKEQLVLSGLMTNVSGAAI